MSKSTFDPKSRSGEHVIIVRHLAVLRGRSVLQPIMTDADGGIRASTVARKVWVSGRHIGRSTPRWSMWPTPRPASASRTL